MFSLASTVGDSAWFMWAFGGGMFAVAIVLALVASKYFGDN